MILFLIELFCECTELERSNYVQRCIRKESSFKNRSRCCCTLSYDLTKTNYKDFSTFKKKQSHFKFRCLETLLHPSVCWFSSTKKVLSYAVFVTIQQAICLTTNKNTKKQRKGGQNEMFSVFLHFSLRKYLANLETIFLLCALAQSLTHYLLLLTFLSSFLLVVTEVIFLN